MLIESSGHSDVGRERDHNEDAFVVDAALSLYVVCDGMGGHASGEVASSTTIVTIQEAVRAHKKVLDDVAAERRPIAEAAAVLREAIEAAAGKLHAAGEADQARRGMGTTCSALLVVGTRGVMGHVGDSRLYLLRQEQLYQLSDDHTFLAEAVKRGVITPEQARHSTHGNVITRAVGPTPTVLVDVLTFDVLPGDTYLLCSDGLHQYVEDPRELATMMKAPVLDELGRTLIKVANDRGGSDNITAVLVHASAAEPAESARLTQVSENFGALRHVGLFNDLSMPELVRAYSAFRLANHRAGDVVVREGEPGESLFVLVEGEAVVTRRGVKIARLASGAHFGEMALLTERPRSASVEIASPEARLLLLSRSEFVVLTQQDAMLAAKFLYKLAQTLSLRLDDLYLHRGDAAAAASPGDPKTTMRVGLFQPPPPPKGR